MKALKRTPRPVILLVTLLILTSYFMMIQPPAAAEGNVVDIKVHLSGEPVLAISGSSTYHGTLLDTKNRMWNYEVYVTSTEGENITGASPSLESPATGNLTISNKTFSFDLMAPLEPGDIDININISSFTGDKWYKTTHTIAVVRPVTISATIDNPSNTAVTNATVRFYVDNDHIDTQIVDQIPPGDSTDVSAEWILAEFPPGWHDTRLEIDLDNNGEAEWTVHDRFYVEGGGTLILYLTILFGLIAMLGGIYYISKRKMR
ncbi:MAG: hypothetical protein AYK23_01730 [Candidatus Proteinoplasmatales archaeon SG8-5]|nr:MAG: hypothetical protein AYK23_01730 [Candidatus Proteinoplasmatales archaeon SG8-5]